jgi:hypothetical protein
MPKATLLGAGLLLWAAGLAGQDVRDAWNAASIRGTVFSSGYGTSVEGARVTFRDGSLELSAVSDSDGRYSIGRISPGKYAVTVTCPGFATKGSDITIGASPVELSIPIDVGLQIDYGPVAEVKGTIIDATKNPIAGATIVVVSPFDVRVSLRTLTGADGRYKLGLPRAGQYVVYASKEGFQVQTKAIITNCQPTPLDFKLSRFHLNGR